MPTQDKITGFSDAKEVSRFTGKSIPTIYRWAKSGLLPASVKIGPNSVAWRNSDLDDWAEDPEAWRKAHGQTGWVSEQEAGNAA